MFRQLPDKVQIDVNLNLNLTVNVPFQTAVFTTLFNQFQEVIMSLLSDKIAELNTSVDAAVQRVQDDVTAFGVKIADLEAKVAAGSASPAEIQALDDLKAKIDAIDPTKPEVLPEPEPTPEPAPEPAPEG